MTLYETIFARRQVRTFSQTPLEKQTLEDIENFIADTEHLDGQCGQFKVVPASVVSGGNAPNYILSYCNDNSSAYANVGYIIQKVDLYIQSIGLGSGWFMNVKPQNNTETFCIALAFGHTDIPIRTGPNDFKRLPVEKISNIDNAVEKAVRLSPSALNSQPWKLDFDKEKVIITDHGRGLMRPMLRNKLNKIDVGIAARHAVLALEQDGCTISHVMPKTTGKGFVVEISYQ